MEKISGTHICTECGFRIEWHGHIPHLLSSPDGFQMVSNMGYTLPPPKDGIIKFEKRCPKCDRYQWFTHHVSS